MKDVKDFYGDAGSKPICPLAGRKRKAMNEAPQGLPFELVWASRLGLPQE